MPRTRPVAVLHQASAAHQAGTGGLSVTINSMNPQYATPGATVTVEGTVSNRSSQTRAGLGVQLFTSATKFVTRDQMDSYLANGGDSSLIAAGTPFTLPASVAPGGSASWTASFQVSTQGISAFGVYGVTAQLQDLSSGVVFSSDQTLLPFWPGQQSAGLLRPLKISWLWPLIDQPHHQVCAALTNNDLAASLQSGGRLSALLTAGASHADADLTWVIDPALLSDVATMTQPYEVGSKPNCTAAAKEPASKAAASWLAALRKVTPGQPTVITPYANVDMTALVHEGLTTDLTAAYDTGDAIADSVLGGNFGHELAWPPGGTADLSVLADLATREYVGTVVLNSSQMPPSSGGTVFQPDDAVASVRVAGLPLNVLLSDDTLTGVLKAGDTSSGILPKDAEFAVRQRFLAETAMIAAEAPNSARTIVVAPPEDWSPSEALASDLLGETTTSPWLTPAPLGSLSSAPDTQRTAPRQSPPATKASPGELSASYLGQVRSLETQLSVYNSMLYKPAPGYVQALDQALIATESAAWRGSGTSQGLAQVDNLRDYLKSAEKKVKILITSASSQVSMAGSSGQVPVSIQNGLLLQAIEVKVVASAAPTSQLTIGRLKGQGLIIVPPQQVVTVRLPISSAPQGSTLIKLSLAGANGTPLTFTDNSLTVHSTRYGRAILVLIAAAIGVLVLTSVYRGIRRSLHGDTHLVNEEADPPGSVVTGTSDALHPTEAPDDLADARRWVDDA